MKRKTFLRAAAAAAFVAALGAGAKAQKVAIDNDDIGGTVTGPAGPEAGVWVIAETTDLPTKYAKMVVTNDKGQYVLPDLPKAKYKVWVRGYGLVDSAKVDAEPGKPLDLKAVKAPDEKAAAQYYPALYWYSMMKIPGTDQFGGKSDIPANVKQTDWLMQMKNIGCVGCHQLGQTSTRTFPSSLGKFDSHEDAWIRRIGSGQYGEQMINQLAGRFAGEPIKYLADWTRRIEKGETPAVKPERPKGLERNVVVTSWEWSTPDKYLHDLIASDRRYPTVNAYGPLYGAPEYSTDNMPILDPKTHKVTFYKLPVRDKDMPESLGPGHAACAKLNEPSPYWGDKKLWDTRANNHNSMFGRDGRLWLAATIRGRDTPAFCKKGSDHPSAKIMPLDKNSRQAAVYDPKTKEYKFIDLCFGTHHLQFGYDKDETLWFSGTGPVVGWLNSKQFDATGDAQKAQGWFPYVLDTNGNGRLDEFVGAKGKIDPTKDKQIIPGSGAYAVMPSPADGSIWFTIGAFRGQAGFARFDPKTKLSEVFYVPAPAFGIRGGDIDKDGVAWGSASSGHMVSFDRRKCKGPLNGPKALGNHCPEGWSFYKYPGPGFAGIGDNSAESSYYSWVDQHGVAGLGENIPMSTANLMGGIVALKDGQMISLRVPYPLGFYAKGFDGRIDDPKAGWKGRGLWTTNGDRTPWLQEGGKGSMPRAVHIQVRPDPLSH
ncbi:MAG: carboxypeptidase regulatory-like domain-containing protein [Beijerinckiaceae bacterium]